jgi:hypothetical protein
MNMAEQRMLNDQKDYGRKMSPMRDLHVCRYINQMSCAYLIITMLPSAITVNNNAVH